MLSPDEIATHNSRESCWVIVAGQVYDLTDFLGHHPGGANVILRYGGKDATEEYEAVHAAGTIENGLPKEKHLGPASPVSNKEAPVVATPASVTGDARPLEICQSLEDIEHAALQKLSPRARVYFESSAESEAAHRGNKAHWSAVSFWPRVLRDVSHVSMRCQIMGAASSLPIFIAPAAAAKLGHPDGELCLARGAARMAIPQAVCTYSSVSHQEIMDCFRNDPGKRGGALFFQLYIPAAKKEAEALISKAKSLGFEALIVTVDSPVIGKRTSDDRLKAVINHAAGMMSPVSQPPLPGEEAETLRGVHCSSLEWADLQWIRKCWGHKPIILKGIQSADDALEASKNDVDGIYLSNHGGRQLDFAPSSIQTLWEIRRRFPQVLEKMDIYVDGGVSRGSDVVKALCLGARAVGLGRAFMYALSAYGAEGVVRTIEILSDEIQTTMRLLGVRTIAELNSSFVDPGRLDFLFGGGYIKARI
ncbi:hypothetical protein GQ53DRAFT_851078 [Thozetella sp. PMI_491]|nr:hypothetical protein GQ53DRAFT_851078 [Thozetella sp. PMI_491]